MLEVPQLDFTTFKYVAPMLAFSGGDDQRKAYFSYNGPSQAIQRVALAVAGLGQILTMTRMPTNATWETKFHGPALRCDNVIGTERVKILRNVLHGHLLNVFGPSPVYEGTYALDPYMAWVPWAHTGLDPTTIDTSLPFMFNMSNQSDWTTASAVSSLNPATLNVNGSASLYLAVLPRTDEYVVMGSSWKNEGNHTVIDSIRFHNLVTHGFVTCSNVTINGDIGSLEDPLCIAPSSNGTITFTLASVFSGSTLLKCDLVNSTYTVQFDDTQSGQRVRILNQTMQDLPTLRTSPIFGGPFNGGPVGSADPNCTPFNAGLGSTREHLPCEFHAEDLRLLSYQGISSAFNEVVLGSIRSDYLNVFVNTTVTKTVLAQTKELANLQRVSYSNLQQQIADNRFWPYPELVRYPLQEARGDLASTLEELFRNFTVSLLAEPYFQYVSSLLCTS